MDQKSLLPGKYEGFLYLLILVGAFLTVRVALHKDFDRDEFEHIHASWYMINGQMPYRDFFEHHHPLLWLVLSPLLSWSGESIETVLYARVLMAAGVLVIAFLTYKLARRIDLDRITALMAAALLLSVQLFVAEAVEIRPDGPQLIFSLLSFILFLRALDEKRPADFLISAVSLFVAFLFLQKAVLILPVYAGIFLWRWRRREMALTTGLPFAAGLIVPLVFSCFFLVGMGIWRDYWVLNWLLNVEKVKEFWPVDTIKRTVEQNTLFWLCAAGGLGSMLLRRRCSDLRMVLILTAAYLFVAVMFLPKPHPHYFLSAFPFLAVIAAEFIAKAREKLRSNFGGVLLIVLVFGNGTYFLIDKQLGPADKERQLRQLARIEFVLRHSQPRDPVFDGHAVFNLFRPDLHYFWFSVHEQSQNPALYRAHMGDRQAPYDACRLIKRKRPVIISDQIDLDACGLADEYRPTAFDKIYLRRSPN